jgi:CheY-like chemotaxis protein
VSSFERRSVSRSIAAGCEGPLILVVDDDLDIRDTLADVLRDAGYRIALAGDGLEALAYLRTHEPPDLILLDWMMPRCDGASFRAAQISEPALAAIPVVLLTADAHVTRAGHPSNAGGFLRKPVQLAELLRMVERHCIKKAFTEPDAAP